MMSYSGLFYTLAGFVIACSIWIIVTLVRKRLLSSSLSYRKRFSQQAEAQALQLLQKKGFSITAVQPALNYTIHVGETTQQVLICADFLVAKNGYTFVAEVKCGDFASDIRTIATRRQLLEYYCAYEVDGILLIDMTKKQINLIQFAFGEESATD